jgi:hypothetical protein
MHALGMAYILVNTNLKLNDFTRRLRTPSCFMWAIIGPASDVKRPIFTLFSAVARVVTEVAQIILNIP